MTGAGTGAALKANRVEDDDGAVAATGCLLAKLNPELPNDEAKDVAAGVLTFTTGVSELFGFKTSASLFVSIASGEGTIVVVNTG